MYGYRGRTGLAIFIITLIIIIIFIITIDYRIKGSLINLARAEAQTSGTETINRIINERVVSGIKYSDLVSIHKDEHGKIVLIQPNTIALNEIMSSTLIELAQSLGQMQENTIEIPLGQLTGSKMLAGYGPRFNVKVIPSGQVHVKVLNEFDQAGINQTRHLIYFEIRSTILVAVPLMKDEVEVVSVVPLAETIIVGEVPETYVNFMGATDMLYPLIKEK